METRPSRPSSWLIGRILVLAWVLFALPALPAFALGASRRITQLTHDSWTPRTGAPSGAITAITQTPDGYLWLGTTAEGLVQFDGVRFRRAEDLDALFPIRADDIRSVFTSRDGTLWVGTAHGLARRTAGGFELVEDTRSRYATSLAEAADGRIVFTRSGGLSILEGAHVTSIHPGHAGSSVSTIGLEGTIWLGTARGLLAFDRDGRLQGAPLDGYVSALLADRKDRLWVATRRGLHRLAKGAVDAGPGSPASLPDTDITALLEDRDGGIWAGTMSKGLRRVGPATPESFGAAEGLTANGITTLFEDREGSLWVGTAAGLDRFREGTFTPLGAREGLPNDAVASVLETRDASLWTFCDGGGVVRMRGRESRIFTTKDGLASNFGGPLFESRDGSLWVGHDRGLSRIRGNSITAYQTGDLASRYVSSITEDDESLIVFVLGLGLYRFREGKLERYAFVEGGSFDFAMAHAMHVSRDGTLWLGTARGVVSVRKGVARSVWSASRWAVSSSIHEDAHGVVWVATWRGLVRIVGDSAVLIDTTKGLDHDRILSVVEDRLGFLWMSCPHGIFRVRRDELDEVAQRQRERVTSDVFGLADGMRSAEATARAVPSGWAASNGLLYFATRQGLVSVDPSTILRNPLPPPVVLEEVRVDGLTADKGGIVHVPAGAQRVQVSYNGLSLLAPERVRFRYRLEGYDKDWVDAGTRRTAYYTSITPGRHLFRATACNNDGVWNEKGVTLTMEVGRLWYTTPWFFGALLLTVAGTVGFVFRLRILSLRARERVLEERIRERTQALRSEITERERAEAALRESEERYELAIRGTNEGIWDWDFATGIVYLSPLWRSILGCEGAELGSGDDEWFNRIHPDDLERVRGKLIGYRGSSISQYADEFRMRHADGGYRWILSRGYAVRNAEGRCERLVGAISDVTTYRSYDPLTGLANRTLFMERLADAVQRANQDPTRRCAVALLNLDRFKRVIDSLGHSFGDGLLVAVAKRIEGALRPGDVVGRMAGDEFALLIEGVSGVEDASQAALRVRDDLARPFLIAGTETFLSATMGVAVWSERYVRAEDLLRDASTALHEASSRGRNQSEVFHEGMRAQVVSTLELETGLRRALDRGEFVVHYQPVVSLASGLVVGFEALVRWNHPDRGLLYPGAFIPLAEETRLIHPLGRLVRRLACEQLQAWHTEARGTDKLWMSVNASGREFAEPELAREVRALLRSNRLAPSSLHIEVTETVLLGGDPRVASTLTRLHELGTPLDIDDFGTGFSSLSYLQQIPASTLKIDRSFVARLGSGRRGEAVVETILSLAKSLSLTVVAEGVETAEQLEALQRLGCHNVQGYYLSHPVPADQAMVQIGVPMLPVKGTGDPQVDEARGI